MDLVTLVSSALSGSSSLSAAVSTSAKQLLATMKTAQGFFAVAGQFAVTRELSSELGPFAMLLPWGSIEKPFAASFAHQYGMIAAKDLPARLRNIELPSISKPDMQNAAKFVSPPKT